MITCSFREAPLNEHLLKRICFFRTGYGLVNIQIQSKSNELADIMFNLRFSN